MGTDGMAAGGAAARKTLIPVDHIQELTAPTKRAASVAPPCHPGSYGLEQNITRDII